MFNLVEWDYYYWIQHEILVQIGVVQHCARQYWPPKVMKAERRPKQSNIFWDTVSEQIVVECFEQTPFSHPSIEHLGPWRVHLPAVTAKLLQSFWLHNFLPSICVTFASSPLQFLMQVMNFFASDLSLNLQYRWIEYSSYYTWCLVIRWRKPTWNMS